jgi:hypothetical protein
VPSPSCTSHHYLVDPSKGKGATKAPLYAAFGAAAWNAQSALLQSRLSFAGAPVVESPAGAGSAGISDDAQLEIHMQRIWDRETSMGTAVRKPKSNPVGCSLPPQPTRFVVGCKVHLSLLEFADSEMNSHYPKSGSYC